MRGELLGPCPAYKNVSNVQNADAIDTDLLYEFVSKYNSPFSQKGDPIVHNITEFVGHLRSIGPTTDLICYCRKSGLDYHHKSCHADVITTLARHRDRILNRLLNHHYRVTNIINPATEMTAIKPEDANSTHVKDAKPRVCIQFGSMFGSPFNNPLSNATQYHNAVIKLQPNALKVLTEYLRTYGHHERYVEQLKRSLRGDHMPELVCARACTINPAQCHGPVLKRLAQMPDIHLDKLHEILNTPREQEEETLATMPTSYTALVMHLQEETAHDTSAFNVQTRSQAARAEVEQKFPLTLKEFEALGRRVARGLGSRIGPPCFCPMGHHHQQVGHQRYTSTCEQCVMHAGPKRQCRRVEASGVFGSLVFDIATLGHELCSSLIAQFRTPFGSLYSSIAIKSKSEQELVAAIFETIAALSYLYPGAPPVIRVHWDGELGAASGKVAMHRVAIQFTNDPGSASGTIGNKAGEGAVARVTRRAAVALSVFSEPVMRQFLWPHAMQWSAQSLSCDNIPEDVHSRLRPADMIAFGTSCLMYDPQSHENPKTDPKWKRGIFLHHSAQVTKGKVMMRADKTITVCQDIRPLVKGDGTFQFLMSEAVPPINFKGYCSTRTCRTCGKVRVLKARNPKVSPENFKCDHCRGVTCQTPATSEPLPLKRGPKVMLAACSPTDCTLDRLQEETRQWDIVADDHEEENIGRVDFASMLVHHPDVVKYDIGADDENTRYVLVTKLLSKQEQQSDEHMQKCDAATSDEVKKFVKHGPWARPKSHQTCIDELEKNDDAELAHVALIISIKNYQKSKSDWRYKCRIILLGDRIVSLVEGRRIKSFGNPWVACSSQEAVRIAIARSLCLQRVCSSVDIEAAYLQAIWPADRPPVYVVIPESIYKFFPAELRPPAGMQKPRWRLLRCMYGHPMSGKIFSDQLQQVLFRQGFQVIAADQSILYRRTHRLSNAVPGDIKEDETMKQADGDITVDQYDTMVSCYVDDLVTDNAAGGQTFAPIRETFDFEDPVEQAQEHLGQKFLWWEDDKSRYCDVDMADYVKMLVQSFDSMPAEVSQLLEDLGIEVEENGSSRSPFFDDCIRPSLIGDDDPDNQPLPITPAVMKFIQSMIGGHLWAVRCGRHELGYTVSILSSQVTRWSRNCFKALINMVNYLRSSRNLVLRFKCPKDMDMSSTGESPALITATDADLPGNARRPRLCAYSYLGYPSESELDPAEQTLHLPLSFKTRSAAVVCDSTPSAETLAIHHGARIALRLAPMLGDLFTRAWTPTTSLRPVIPPAYVLGDNTPSLTGADGAGISTALEYMTRTCLLRAAWLADCKRLGILNVEKVSSAKNGADLGTKRQPLVGLFQRLRMIGLWEQEQSQ